SITGNRQSTLAKAAHSHLNVHVDEEACPLQLAPTASTTATLAMGDALAVSLMKARDFQPENFARFHPGGSLGRRLLSRVENEMATKDLPFVSQDTPLVDVIHKVTEGRLGLAIVNDVDGYAMVTDGDLRRAFQEFTTDVFAKCASDIMSVNPVSIAVGTRVQDAFELMESKKITSLLVTEDDKVKGVFKK
ncbi:MAG: CBS domain-containing protein, partial [Pontibacterium sp.]